MTLGTIELTPGECARLDAEECAHDAHVYAPARRRAHDALRRSGMEPVDVRVHGDLYRWRDPATGHLLSVTATGRVLRFVLRADGYAYAVR